MIWLICGYCDLKCFMENPTINKKRSKVCNTYIDKPIYAPRGPFMKMGNVIILKYYITFFVKVIVRAFHDEIMKVLLKCSSMGTKCANPIR